MGDIKDKMIYFRLLIFWFRVFIFLKILVFICLKKKLGIVIYYVGVVKIFGLV